MSQPFFDMPDDFFDWAAAEIGMYGEPSGDDRDALVAYYEELADRWDNAAARDDHPVIAVNGWRRLAAIARQTAAYIWAGGELQ